jgi:hypothetical protein
MEKTWKPRSKWPEVMTVKDLIDCVPFLGRPRAQAIMEKIGTKVGGNWAVSRAQLIGYLDGDRNWEAGEMREWLKEVDRQVKEYKKFFGVKEESE